VSVAALLNWISALMRLNKPLLSPLKQMPTKLI
jgi:hypothetical protein